VDWNPLTNSFVERYSSTIAYVDPIIPGKRLGENNAQLFSWHWPGDDESRLPIVTAISHQTILSMMNATNGGLPDPSWKSESFGAAMTRQLQMVVRMPVELPHSSITLTL